MRTLVGFGLSLLLATGLFAQHRGGFSNPHPFPQGTFGNVVFPAARQRLGGTAARGKASGGNPPFRAHAGPDRSIPCYGYPVYVGGYSDNANPAEPAPPTAARYHGE